MKKLGKLLLACVAMTSMMSCSIFDGGDNVLDENHFKVTDMVNREVIIKKNPEKFVCLGPGCLRQYCYVGDTSKIIGIENIDKGIKSAKPYLYAIPNSEELPVIGQGGPKDTTNNEMLMALKPDVIFTAYNQDIKAIEQLQTITNIPVVAIGYDSDGLFEPLIYNSIKLIGKVTGKEQRAKEVVDYFEASKAELMEKASVNPTNLRGYMGAVNRRGSHGITHTTGDFPIFDVLGVKNVVHEKNIHGFMDIELSALYELQPDFMIIDAAGLSEVTADYGKRPEFYNSLNAVKNNQVYIQLPFVNYSANFDIALADAYYIGSVVYPEQFEGLDMPAKFDEIMQFLLGVDAYSEVSGRYGNYGKLDFSIL